MAGKVISILNMKGGVGKTTLACNIALELAQRDNRVLVIDVDPQFNTTQTLFKLYTNSVNEYNRLRESGMTIRKIFNTDSKQRGITKKRINIEENTNSVIHEFKNITIGGKEQKGLDLIPGDLSLIVDINAAASDKFKGFFYREKFKENYDYIIIDCPPTWGELTSIALTLSDYYLIPTKLDEFSTIGITILSEQLSEKVAALEGGLKCLGVVYTMLNETTAENGIAITHRPFKTAIEKYYDYMSQEVDSKVKEFSTVFYNIKAIATDTVVYKVHTRYPDLYERVKDLVDEIIGRISSLENTSKDKEA